MWPIVSLTASKYLWFLGGLVIAVRIAVGSGNMTGVNGGPVYVPDFNSAGVYSRTAKFPAEFPFFAYVRANTGSTTKAYPASCFRNPLRAISKSSGSVLRLVFHAGANPTGVAGDISITKGCGDEYGSGSTILIDNTCTGSGCVSYYTTGTAKIGSGDFIKFTPSAALAPGFTGRISGSVEDIWGE